MFAQLQYAHLRWRCNISINNILIVNVLFCSQQTKTLNIFKNCYFNISADLLVSKIERFLSLATNPSQMKCNKTKQKKKELPFALKEHYCFLAPAGWEITLLLFTTWNSKMNLSGINYWRNYHNFLFWLSKWNQLHTELIQYWVLTSPKVLSP